MYGSTPAPPGINLIHKKAKKAATSKLVGFKWCEIHEEWFIKDLMVPMGTELNNVINNYKKYISHRQGSHATPRLLHRLRERKQPEVDCPGIFAIF